MNNKLVGYILSIVGIVGLLVSFKEVQALAAITLPAATSNIVMFVSLGIFAVGIFFVAKSGSSEEVKEVPIYKGKEIVGYRRI